MTSGELASSSKAFASIEMGKALAVTVRPS
jgi:hypothetical protein